MPEPPTASTDGFKLLMPTWVTAAAAVAGVFSDIRLGSILRLQITGYGGQLNLNAAFFTKRQRTRQSGRPIAMVGQRARVLAAGDQRRNSPPLGRRSDGYCLSPTCTPSGASQRVASPAERQPMLLPPVGCVSWIVFHRTR